MPDAKKPISNPPARSEIDRFPGKLLLEFGTDWCPHCQAAQAPLARVLADFSELSHIRIEDGPGRQPGRSFRVKLWPTLILLHDGQEIARLVRPITETEIRRLLEYPAGP